METILKVGGIYSVETKVALNQICYRIVVVVMNNTPITSDTEYFDLYKIKMPDQNLTRDDVLCILEDQITFSEIIKQNFVIRSKYNISIDGYLGQVPEKMMEELKTARIVKEYSNLPLIKK